MSLLNNKRTRYRIALLDDFIRDKAFDFSCRLRRLDEVDRHLHEIISEIKKNRLAQEMEFKRLRELIEKADDEVYTGYRSLEDELSSMQDKHAEGA